jgi:hypothetical protein
VDFFWGKFLHLAEKEKRGACDKYKGFFLKGKNGLLTSHYNGFKKKKSVYIFSQTWSYICSQICDPLVDNPTQHWLDFEPFDLTPNDLPSNRTQPVLFSFDFFYFNVAELAIIHNMN